MVFCGSFYSMQHCIFTVFFSYQQDANVRLIRELREEIARLKSLLGGNMVSFRHNVLALFTGAFWLCFASSLNPSDSYS